MKDPALRCVSYAARGLWIDLMCVMFESPSRGHLQMATGKPLTPEHIGRMTGGSADEVATLLRELEDAGVFSRTDVGTIYSRRMVRDEKIRSVRSDAGQKGAEYGHLGGRPTTANKTAKKTSNEGQTEGQNNPPSVSSSSSKKEKLLCDAHTTNKSEYPSEFENCWVNYPARAGGNPKRDAFKAWGARLKEGHNAADLLAGTRRYSEFCDATGKRKTEFVMQAARFFGQSKPFLELWAVPHDNTNQRQSGGPNVDIYRRAT